MHTDVILIGGSFAGLSAAMYVARARRSVCVIDTGLPRNRFAEHSHGFFAQDGSEPGTMLATARAQVALYPTVTFIQGKAVTAAKGPDRFFVILESGDVFEGSRLVLAFGISDELPDLSGLRERWGKSVIHCPYCHGYEFSGKRLGVLNLSPMSGHQAMMTSEWGPTTFFLNGALPLDKGLLDQIKKRGVAIEPAPVKALHGSGTDLSAIELENGRMVDLDALYIAPRARLNSDIAQQLGCETEEAPYGLMLRTDAQKMTSVPGVFAAGDITRGSHTVAYASADGVTAAIAAHRSLIF